MAHSRHRVSRIICSQMRTEGIELGRCLIHPSAAVASSKVDGFTFFSEMSCVVCWPPRRLLCVLVAAAIYSSPVMTVDGQWTGIQNGYSMSLSMAQTGSDVTGTGAIGGIAGSAEGTLTGTFTYPNLKVTITIPGFDDPVVYTGTMSQAAAKINGKLNGSGFTDVEVDVQKR